MVDEQLGIHAEEAVEQVLVVHRAARHLAHRVQAVGLKLLRNAATHTPESGQRTVVPQETPVAHLIELGNAHAVGVGLRLFGHNVHRHLGQIEVGADAGSGSDARLAEHLADHLHRHFMGRETVVVEIVGDVHEDFVDGIGMDVLGGHMTQVDVVNLPTHLHIARHARRRHKVVELEVGAGLQLDIVGRGTREAARRQTAPALLIDLPDALHDLEEARPSADAVLLERRRDGQTDGLLRAAQISHNEIGGERIEPAVHTLHGGVERLQVDGDIGSLLLLHSDRLYQSGI